MIKTVLDRESGLKILELGKRFHEESRFKDGEEFNPERVWNVLQKISTYPSHYFIAYDDQYRGLIAMIRTENYWSGETLAQDLAFYVEPESRGSTLAVRLEKAAREWASQIGATEMVIYHNTGIKTNKAPALFEKLGYTQRGFIFSREI